MMAPLPDLPLLPLVCLQTANDVTTHSIVVKGKTTVIDFWTTRCTRCPAALTKLDQRAIEKPDVRFVSICCDQLDGARHIIDGPDVPLWQHVEHYYMTSEDKEKAKAVFGFRQVPFYVIVDEEGEICQMGNKIDWDNLTQEEAQRDDKENAVQEPPVVKDVASEVPREFVVDDLDF